MKYNLKNRPKPIILKGSPKILRDETIPISWKEYEKWFEGFEKELRNWQENLRDLPDNHVARIILKEILGES